MVNTLSPAPICSSAACLLYTEQVKPQAVTFLHSPHELTLKRAVLTIYAYYYLHFYYIYLFCVYCMHVAVHLPQQPCEGQRTTTTVNYLHHVGPGYPIQVIKLAGRYLYLLNYLAEPFSFTFLILVFTILN